MNRSCEGRWEISVIPARPRSRRRYDVEVHELVVVGPSSSLRAALLGSTSAIRRVLRSASAPVRSHALEAQQQAAAVHPADSMVSGPGSGGVGREHRAGAEPQLGLVGAHLDGDARPLDVPWARPMRPTTNCTIRNSPVQPLGLNDRAGDG